MICCCYANGIEYISLLCLLYVDFVNKLKINFYTFFLKKNILKLQQKQQTNDKIF